MNLDPGNPEIQKEPGLSRTCETCGGGRHPPPSPAQAGFSLLHLVTTGGIIFINPGDMLSNPAVWALIGVNSALWLIIHPEVIRCALRSTLGKDF